MAILSGSEIRRQIDLGRILIDPFDPKYVNPNSVDLHLGDKLLRYECRRKTPHTRPKYFDHRPITMPINSRNPPDVVTVPRRMGGWILWPGVLYLGVTREYTETRGFVPYVDGRSSMGRLGLFCHVTAGRGDNGFMGNWTLELVAVEPLIIYPGQRLAQITYHTIFGDQLMYGETGNTSGRYQGDRGPAPIKLGDGDR